MERGSLSHLGMDLVSSWTWGGSGAMSAFRKNVEKRWLLENMDGAFLVLDEIVDGG